MIDTAVKFLLALSIGLIMGLEREIVQQREKERSFAGVRTFSLFAIFGFLITFFAFDILKSTWAFIVGFAGCLVLIIAAYIMLALKKGRTGATTEIAAMITFILSVIVSLDSAKEWRLTAIIIAVIVASFLALKENLHKFAKGIQVSEVYATIKMALISIVILPLLPNKNYTLLDIPLLNNLLLAFPKITEVLQQLDVFNPFKIWLMVVLISGLSFVGYVLIKTVGENKGLGLTSFFGGIVSSTALTVALAEKSKDKKIAHPFVFGIVLASSVMFIRVLLIISAINPGLIKLIILPLGLMAVTALICAFAITRFKKEKIKEKIEFKTPFAIWPSIRFGILFTLILVASKLLYLILGDKGVYIASLISGLADADAMVLTLASLSISNFIAIKVAVLGIVLAVCSNTLVKVGIVYYLGSKRVAKYLMWITFLILAVGLLTTFMLIH